MKESGWHSNGPVVGSELHSKVVALFADIFQINISSDLEDIGRNEIETWDSVNHLRLVAELEEVFQIELSDDEVTTIASLRDVERLLLKLPIIWNAETAA